MCETMELMNGQKMSITKTANVALPYWHQLQLLATYGWINSALINSMLKSEISKSR